MTSEFFSENNLLDNNHMFTRKADCKYLAKVLIVEDEAMIRDLYLDILKNLELKLCFVENGEKALDEWQKDDFDLLISDIGLPGISGWDVIEKIRQEKPELPVVVISGLAGKIDKMKAEKLKINHFLPKPVNLNDFSSLVLKCVGIENQPAC